MLEKELEAVPRQRKKLTTSMSLSKIEASIMHKRQSWNFEQPPIPKDSNRNIFEHFFIVGIPPDAENPEEMVPRIIFLFPAAPLLMRSNEFDQVVNFSFPNGFRRLPELKPHDPIILEEFSFRLSGNDQALYGCCVHLRIPPGKQLFFSSEKSSSYPFCFCIISKIPILSSHFQFLTYLVRAICGIEKPIERSHNELSYTPISEGETLPDLTVLTGVGRWRKMLFPRPFRIELVYYRSMSQRPGQDQDFKLSVDSRLLIPMICSDFKALGYSSLDTLFSIFEIEEIIEIYTAILLDHHTLVISDSPHKLSLSVLALRSLMNPFVIGGSYMPLVPNLPEYLQMLESPVPFICGCLKSSLLKTISLNEPICIVDIDEKTIVDKSLNVSLPNSGIIIKSINDFLKEQSDIITVPPKFIRKGLFSSISLNPQYKPFIDRIHGYMKPKAFLEQIEQKYVFTPEIVDHIQQIFYDNFKTPLESSIRPCFVTDSTDVDKPVTVFNHEIFMMSIDRKDEPFYSQFSHSSIFQLFCDGKTDETDLDKKSYVNSLSDHCAENSFLVG